MRPCVYQERIGLAWLLQRQAAAVETRLFCFGFLNVIYFNLKSGAMRANITWLIAPASSS